MMFAFTQLPFSPAQSILITDIGIFIFYQPFIVSFKVNLHLFSHNPQHEV